MQVILRWKSDSDPEWKGYVVFTSSDRRTLDNAQLPPGHPLPTPIREGIEKILASPDLPRGTRDEWKEFTLQHDHFGVTTVISHEQIHLLI